MANVGFKLGLQASADLMLANPDGYDIESGSFYLTSDTHRLYIGAEPTRILNDGTVEVTGVKPHLFPLNEGIITVSDLNHLPVFEPGTPTEKAAIGTFYYVESENILCIYGGVNGQGWIQVNTNTDTNITGVTYTVTSEGETKAVVTFGLRDSQSKVLSDTFSIEVKGGITQEIDGNNIVLTGDTYSLVLEAADETGTAFNIKLNSGNTDNDSVIKLEAGDGVSLQQEGQNLKISAEEANQIVGVSVEQGYVDSSADKEGFRVKLTSKTGAVLESDNFNPKITYGINAKETVTFKKGVAVLEAYTAQEIQKILRELNAMHYLGTIGANGSAAQQIVVDGNGTKIMKSDGTELQVKIGDMFIVSQTIDGIVVGTNYQTGTILICNSSSGMEDPTTGYINSNELEIEAIESTLDSDTTYTLTPTETEDDKYGVKLSTKNSGDYGTFLLTSSNEAAGPILISAERGGTTERPEYTVSIGHSTLPTNIATDTSDVTSQQSGQDLDIPVIVGVDADGYGHVSAIKLQMYRVKDTITRMKELKASSHSYTEDGVNVGSVGITVTSATDQGAESSTIGYFNLTSKTLAIEIDNTKSNIQGGSTQQAGLAINMVWGEF